MRVLHAAAGDVLGLAFSPDGRAVAAAVEHQGVFLWELDGPAPPRRLDPTATHRTRGLFFAPDGRSVHWFGWQGWRAFDRDTGKTAPRRLPADGTLLWLAQTPDGSRLLSEHSFPEPSLVGWEPGADGWEKRWQVSTADIATHCTTICPTGRRVATLARVASPRVSAWEYPFRLELRSAGSGAVERAGTYPYARECLRLVFSPDGSQLVGAHEMTLLVWAVPDAGAPVAVRNDTRKHFTAVAYHPSGRHLLAASNDTSVQVFDTAGWGRAARFTWGVGRIRAVAVSPDGGLAAAGSDRGEVVVWDLDL